VPQHSTRVAAVWETWTPEFARSHFPDDELQVPFFAEPVRDIRSRWNFVSRIDVDEWEGDMAQERLTASHSSTVESLPMDQSMARFEFVKRFAQDVDALFSSLER